MDVKIHLKDKVETRDYSSLGNDIKHRISGGPKKTVIKIINHDTGDVLWEGNNKVVIPGSQMNAMRVFGLDASVDFPTYNSEMKLDSSHLPGTTPMNEPFVCLFCVSDAGCGSKPGDIKVTKYTDRIIPAPANPSSAEDFTPEMIMPFRFVDINEDLPDELRKYYYGRKTFEKLGKIGYYFKTFDTTPQLHLRYADGTQITENIYEQESEQNAECYVDMRLRITRLDLRDYYENILGWDNARISALSLCFAWYDDTIDQYVYYQDITPYTYLTFAYQQLVDLTVALDILYEIYY